MKVQVLTNDHLISEIELKTITVIMKEQFTTKKIKYVFLRDKQIQCSIKTFQIFSVISYNTEELVIRRNDSITKKKVFKM